MRPGGRRARPTTRRPRTALVLAATVAGGLGLAACSSPSSSSPPTSASTTTSTAPATTTTGSPASTTTTAGSTVCLASALKMAATNGSGAAGTIEMAVTMANQGSASCTLNGYPGMQLLDASGADLPTTVIRGGGPMFADAAANQAPAQVVLAPGAVAKFSFSYEDVPVGNETSCPTSTSSEITPPNDYSYAVIALAIAPCGGGTIHVSPVYPNPG